MSVLSSAGSVAWQLAMEISPILLTGGIAANVGGILPIVALTEGANLIVSVIETGNLSLNSAFAHYKVLPGAKLVNNQVSVMPFANQTVAGNAIISQPRNLSYKMVCPAGPNSGGSALKLLTMMSLQSSLNQHVLAGGLFTCIHPCGIANSGILLDMTDISAEGENTQAQDVWQLNFFFPLVTAQQAQQAQSNLMQSLTSGVPTSPALSGSLGGLGANAALAIGNPFALVSSALGPPVTAQ